MIVTKSMLPQLAIASFLMLTPALLGNIESTISSEKSFVVGTPVKITLTVRNNGQNPVNRKVLSDNPFKIMYKKREKTGWSTLKESSDTALPHGTFLPDEELLVPAEAYTFERTFLFDASTDEKIMFLPGEYEIYATVDINETLNIETNKLHITVTWARGVDGEVFEKMLHGLPKGISREVFFRALTLFDGNWDTTKPIRDFCKEILDEYPESSYTNLLKGYVDRFDKLRIANDAQKKAYRKHLEDTREERKKQQEKERQEWERRGKKPAFKIPDHPYNQIELKK